MGDVLSTIHTLSGPFLYPLLIVGSVILLATQGIDGILCGIFAELFWAAVRGAAGFGSLFLATTPQNSRLPTAFVTVPFGAVVSAAVAFLCLWGGLGLWTRVALMLLVNGGLLAFLTAKIERRGLLAFLTAKLKRS